MSQYNTKVISKVLILRPDDTVLLVKRNQNDEHGPGEWDLPGGTVDPGESYIAAACREAFEEVGVKLTEQDTELVFARSGKYKRGNRCWLFFIAQVPQNQRVRLSEEHSEEQWTSIEEAKTKALFQEQEAALRYVIEEVLGD